VLPGSSVVVRTSSLSPRKVQPRSDFKLHQIGEYVRDTVMLKSFVDIAGMTMMCIAIFAHRICILPNLVISGIPHVLLVGLT
jgi:hypothetical protein